MSEYQYYEFLAIDRPLSAKEQQELRAISMRADISATRFRNEYQWGDLKADPMQLLMRYFDAHVYVTNWGIHRFALRFPREFVDLKTWRMYSASPCLSLREQKDCVVLDFLVHELAERQGTKEAFRSRLEQLVSTHNKKPAFLSRLRDAAVFP